MKTRGVEDIAKAVLYEGLHSLPVPGIGGKELAAP
jgi:hypothetical protein